jgi:hypothetical protein
MKICMVGIIELISFSVVAESPYDKFSTKKNFTDESSISWEQVTNIQKACDHRKELIDKKKYAYKVEACSIWKKNFFGHWHCHIITTKNVSMWTLGHELRHCFQGEFHK